MSTKLKQATKIKSANLLVLIIVIVVLSSCKSKQIQLQEEFTINYLSCIQSELNDVKLKTGLLDLSCRIDFTKISEFTGTYAQGELVFISDQLEDLSDEKKYATMQLVSSTIFARSYDTEYQLQVNHGEDYSVWETTNGDIYIASYYDLEKNGKNIYKNPEKDIALDLKEYIDEGLIVEKDGEYFFADDDSDTKTDEPRRMNVSTREKSTCWSLAQHVISKQLKAPATANFPAYNEATIEKVDDIYEVNGYVDAQNSFGALVRVYFEVLLKKDGDQFYSVDSTIFE